MLDIAWQDWGLVLLIVLVFGLQWETNGKLREIKELLLDIRERQDS